MATNFLGIYSVIISLALSQTIETDKKPVLEQIPCAEQVYEVLGSWESPINWTFRTSSLMGEKVLHSPTEKIGVWLQMSTTQTQTRLMRIAPNENIKIEFKTEQNCRPDISTGPGELKQKNVDIKNSFTDADLENWMIELKKDQKIGLIYIWSPHMKLSYQHLDEARDYAKLKNYRFIAVMDPYGSQARAKEIQKQKHLKNEDLKKMRSIELRRHNGLVHFPSYHFINKDERSFKTLLGYSEYSLLDSWLAGEFK